jgi:hypothetical protein
MVRDYTGLDLTFKKDRLPAFAGSARQMGRYRNGTYIAGLWTDSLAEDLLWYISVRTDEWQRESLTVSSIPSWSWAHLPGQKTYVDGWGLPNKSCELLEILYTPVGDEYMGEGQTEVGGKISTPRIVLRGKLAPLTTAFTAFCKHLAYGMHKSRQTFIAFDRNLRDGELYWFQVVEGMPSSRGVMFLGIILKKLDDTFERVGMANFLLQKVTESEQPNIENLSEDAEYKESLRLFHSPIATIILA